MLTTELPQLLKEMSPTCDNQKYYFATINQSAIFALAGYMQYITCLYQEEEGITIVFLEALKSIVEPRSKQKLVGPLAKITLTINPELLSSEVLAKVCSELAKENISVNIFSAYFHDHLFVPYESKEKALERIKSIEAQK